MPRQKGTGKKAKLSVSVDKAITDKLDQHFKDSRKKSLFVNEILFDNLDSYLAAYNEFIMVDKSANIPDHSVVFEVSAARKEVQESGRSK